MADVFINEPFGAGESEALTATGVQAITINNGFTVIDGVTVEATGNRTLNLTLNSELRAGAKILLLTKANGTETTIFGTGITSVTVTGVAGKTHSQAFSYDGTAFYPDGLTVQID